MVRVEVMARRGEAATMVVPMAVGDWSEQSVLVIVTFVY
jgi:hypothetical protein